jgi:hypothetical protein
MGRIELPSMVSFPLELEARIELATYGLTRKEILL